MGDRERRWGFWELPVTGESSRNSGIFLRRVKPRCWGFTKIGAVLSLTWNGLSWRKVPLSATTNFFWLWKALTIKRRRNDETVSLIIEPKQPKKKGWIQGTKWKDPHPRRQKNHPRGRTTKGTSSSWSISNKERGGPPERRPSLEKPSPSATSRLRIKIAYTCCNTIDTLCL